MAKYIRTLTVIYNTDICHNEIPLFRGAVLKSMGSNANVLYHNHMGESSFRYSYPLIQYKRIGGKAAITCVEEGVDIIGQLITEMPETIIIGKKKLKCEVSRLLPARLLVQTWETTFNYHLNHWLPLNTKNYHLFKATEDENERIIMLENILKGNLLSFLKGIGIRLDNDLLVSFTKLSAPYIIYNKGIGLMGFNADFKCNLSIPNNLGIGKNASLGFGIIHQENHKNQKTNET